MAYVYCDRPDEVEVAVVDHDMEGDTPNHTLEGEPVVIDLGADIEPGPEFDQLWQGIQEEEE